MLRQRFVAGLVGVLPELTAQIQERLGQMLDQSTSSRVAQDRRDALQAFQKLRGAWGEGVADAWRTLLIPPTEARHTRIDEGNFQLIDNEVVENKILSSRMALAVMDKSGMEFNDLKLRIQSVEDGASLPSQDILRAEVILQVLVDQWTCVGLPRSAWVSAQEAIQHTMVRHLAGAYQKANAWLIDQGVVPTIDLKGRVRVTGGGAASTGASHGAGRAPASAGGEDARTPASATDEGRHGGYAGNPRAASAGRPHGDSRPSLFQTAEGAAPGATTSGNAALSTGSQDTGGGSAGSALGRMRQRAHSVVIQLRRLLTDRVAGYDENQGPPASPALLQALADPQIAVAGLSYNAPTALATVRQMDAVQPDVQDVAVALREQSNKLKHTADSPTEKATIEIVALIFQSILAEDRIPPSVRVLFARLQIPVLRVALSEPEFFGTLQHPARRLIDQMGSCVMGFDGSVLQGGALESEIRRVVQVIEQYPETGRRVFQLVYDEFRKFLDGYLLESGATRKVVSVAQQVEQKETLAIQYTIEFRNMLQDMPVRDEIRDFLFKVWAEVLALQAVRRGSQHAETLMLKQCAVDLVWAASAKPSRPERARVIQELPRLLQRLRQGMDLLNIPPDEQNKRIKVIGDALADAFMSRTESISQERIEALARRLANLESVVLPEGSGDLPLDAESIEMLVGIEASSLVVVADGGVRPSQAMKAWARELQPGAWFTLDHNGQQAKVQFVWRSERQHLNLFASADGRNYLIQARRLAAYLQAGLLVPREEESLTVRATRDALSKLDANPERLLV